MVQVGREELAWGTVGLRKGKQEEIQIKTRAGQRAWESGGGGAGGGGRHAEAGDRGKGAELGVG